jgi:4-carboxymuconolactone decarboxylase
MPTERTRNTRTIMAAKTLTSRLPAIAEDLFTPAQRALADAIRSGPRGQFRNSGPFAVFLHSPHFGDLAQKLGGYVRLRTSVPPRLSEFAILVTARIWRSQYEWHAHVSHAKSAGVLPATIADIKAGRRPKKAPKDELAIYDFVTELYKARRVGNRTYGRVNALLGDAGTVELVGILGYYVLVAMTLNVFRMPLPAGVPLPFPEKAG